MGENDSSHVKNSANRRMANLMNVGFMKPAFKHGQRKPKAWEIAVLHDEKKGLCTDIRFKHKQPLKTRWVGRRNNDPEQFSFDRVDNRKPHMLENLTGRCLGCNLARSNRLKKGNYDIGVQCDVPGGCNRLYFVRP